MKNEVFRAPSAKTGNVPILLDETDFTGSRAVKKRTIEEADFDRIALRAMSRRRIPAGVQAFVLPKVRAGVSQAH